MAWRSTGATPPKRGNDSNSVIKVWLIVAIVVILGLVAGALWIRRDTERRPPLFFGIDVPSGNLDELAAVRGAAGRMPSVENIFVKLDSHFTVDTLQRIRLAGLTPMITVEPWSVSSRWNGQPMPQYRLSELTDGRYDQQLRAIAAVIRDFHHPVYLRFAHEMNADWYPWAERANGNRPGDFVAAWRHVYPILRGGNPMVSLIWSPNILLSAARSAPLAELYPGDAYVDAVGLTAYGHGRSAVATIDASYRQLSKLSRRPVILSETGADGPHRADWIRSLGDYLQDHGRIIGFVWFNTTPASTGASGDYRFTADEQSASAFRAVLRRLPLRDQSAS